jgi:hypothetical protein
MPSDHPPFELWGLRIARKNKHFRNWKKKKKRREDQEISKKNLANFS